MLHVHLRTKKSLCSARVHRVPTLVLSTTLVIENRVGTNVGNNYAHKPLWLQLRLWQRLRLRLPLHTATGLDMSHHELKYLRYVETRRAESARFSSCLAPAPRGLSPSLSLSPRFWSKTLSTGTEILPLARVGDFQCTSSRDERRIARGR